VLLPIEQHLALVLLQLYWPLSQVTVALRPLLVGGPTKQKNGCYRLLQYCYYISYTMVRYFVINMTVISYVYQCCVLFNLLFFVCANKLN